MEKWNRLLVFAATWLLLFILVGAVIHIGTYIHHTLLLFSLGVLLAYALDPLVEGLRKTRIGKSGRIPSREFSVGVVFLCFFLVVGFAFWSLEGRIAHEVMLLQTHSARYHDRLFALTMRTDGWLARHGVHFSLTDNIAHPNPDVQHAITGLGHQVLPFVADFFKDVGESVIVLLIAIYFLIYSAEMKEKFNGSLPQELRERVEFWETDVNRILGGFVRGQLTIALLMGLGAAIICLLIGIHIWLLIGLFVVAAALIPVFGPYIGAIPAVLAALIGPTHFHNPVVAVVLILVGFVVINEVGSKILYPKLVGAALGLHAVLVLFVLFAGLEIAGVVGVLFAAPITALVIVTLVHLYRYWQGLPDTLLSVAAVHGGEEAKKEGHP
jgi:predicted PurR-regulated permease PerM